MEELHFEMEYLEVDDQRDRGSRDGSRDRSRASESSSNCSEGRNGKGRLRCGSLEPGGRIRSTTMDSVTAAVKEKFRKRTSTFGSFRDNQTDLLRPGTINRDKSAYCDLSSSAPSSDSRGNLHQYLGYTSSSLYSDRLCENLDKPLTTSRTEICDSKCCDSVNKSVNQGRHLPRKWRKSFLRFLPRSRSKHSDTETEPQTPISDSDQSFKDCPLTKKIVTESINKGLPIIPFAMTTKTIEKKLEDTKAFIRQNSKIFDKSADSSKRRKSNNGSEHGSSKLLSDCSCGEEDCSICVANKSVENTLYMLMDSGHQVPAQAGHQARVDYQSIGTFPRNAPKRRDIITADSMLSRSLETRHGHLEDLGLGRRSPNLGGGSTDMAQLSDKLQSISSLASAADQEAYCVMSPETMMSKGIQGTGKREEFLFINGPAECEKYVLVNRNKTREGFCIIARLGQKDQHCLMKEQANHAEFCVLRNGASSACGIRSAVEQSQAGEEYCVMEPGIVQPQEEYCVMDAGIVQPQEEYCVMDAGIIQPKEEYCVMDAGIIQPQEEYCVMEPGIIKPKDEYSKMNGVVTSHEDYCRMNGQQGDQAAYLVMTPTATAKDKKSFSSSLKPSNKSSSKESNSERQWNAMIGAPKNGLRPNLMRAKSTNENEYCMMQAGQGVKEAAKGGQRRPLSIPGIIKVTCEDSPKKGGGDPSITEEERGYFDMSPVSPRPPPKLVPLQEDSSGGGRFLNPFDSPSTLSRKVSFSQTLGWRGTDSNQDHPREEGGRCTSSPSSDPPSATSSLYNGSALYSGGSEASNLYKLEEGSQPSYLRQMRSHSVVEDPDLTVKKVLYLRRITQENRKATVYKKANKHRGDYDLMDYSVKTPPQEIKQKPAKKFLFSFSN